MASIKNPRRFSEHYGINPSELENRGVLDPTLNVDTRLFIDPLLLEHSQHGEIATGGRATYEQHFGSIIKFLKRVRTHSDSDVAWRTAARLLSFPEIKWTCLGYGARSVSGSGSGNNMTIQYIATAWQIVDLGIEDPDLFAAMALFEEGVGADRISDMTTNVILGDLLAFNERILSELKVPRAKKELRLRNGKTYKASLPENPFIGGGEPVILVPCDILRDLPIVTDWADIADAASENAHLRTQVNESIARLWEVRSRVNKGEIRNWALSNKTAFETFMKMIRAVSPTCYDISSDPSGEVFWRRYLTELAEKHPLSITAPSVMDISGVESVVNQIIEQFQFLIEERRLSEELYHNGLPRPERSAQRLFFAVAHAYCKANNLDLTPEAETGNGPVDFKVSSGFSGRVLVEIKLSRNTKLVKGYTRQLETYKTAEETLKGFYVVIDIGGMGDKDKQLTKIKNEAVAESETVSSIVFVDGKRRPSASKL